MIDLNKCEGWQKRDANGMVLPWYTHPALDDIQSWDLKNKKVFEYGVGQSTIWWASKCKWVYGVDSNEEWVKAMHDAVISNSVIAHIPVKDIYISSLRISRGIDIVVVDGDYRDECVRHAVQTLKKGSKVIIDNWIQPSVWVATEETQSIISKLDHTIYKQPGHPDWQTLIATI